MKNVPNLTQGLSEDKENHFIKHQADHWLFLDNFMAYMKPIYSYGFYFPCSCFKLHQVCNSE